MNNEDWKRLSGLNRLINDGVRIGADFVEKHHRQAAEKPFRVLQSIAAIAGPARVVRGIHDGVLSITYGGIRAINQIAGESSGWVLDRLASTDDDEM